MMRKDLQTVLDEADIVSLRRDFPLGATQRVIVVDRSERYLGIILVSEIHRELPEATQAKDLTQLEDVALLPSLNVRDAMKVFASAEADALAVVDNKIDRKMIGLLTEQHALRRYNEELDRRQNEANLYT